MYLFCSEPVSAMTMRGKLMEWSVALGYSGVEVFPKQISLAGPKDIGNWINLPYFNGDHTVRYAITTDARALWKANNVNTYETLQHGKWIDDVPDLHPRQPTPQEAGAPVPLTSSSLQAGVPLVALGAQRLAITPWS